MKDLERKWDAAEQCARQVRMYGVAVSLLIISFDWIQRERKDKINLATDAVHKSMQQRQFAWSIEAEGGPRTYLMFDIVRDT